MWDVDGKRYVDYVGSWGPMIAGHNHPKVREAYNSDTSRSFDHLPHYPYDTLADLRLPKGCVLVGVELTDDAVELPRFQHPQAAAYVLGRERGSLSPELLARCQHVVKIPTKFCLNVGLAGALVMYDRLIALGGYPARPIMPGGPALEMTEATRLKRS